MHKINNLETVECTQVQRLLDDFLSDELSIETNRQILVHLESCLRCGKERKERARIRKALKRAWESVSLPADLYERIEQDTFREGGRLPAPIRIAAALVIIIAVVAGYLTFRANDRSPLVGLKVIDHYEQVVSDHLRCTGQPVTTLSPRSFLKKIQAQVESLPGAYDLVGVMDCEVEGVKFVHFVFRGRKGFLSLMLEARGEHQTLPETDMTVDISGVEIRMTNQGSLVVASLATRSHFVYIVGDGFDNKGTLELTEHLLPPVQEALIATS